MYKQTDTNVTPEEKAQIDKVFEIVTTLTKTQEAFNKDTSDKLDTLSRGLYGDVGNDSPGLIKRVASIEKLNLAYEKRFEEVERGNWKNSVKITLGATVLSFIVTMATKLFK
jgi:hypothetical protein